MPGDRFYKEGKAVIAKLLEEGAISYKAYWAIVGNKEIAEEMLQNNVFSHHFYADTITFQSTPIQQYCEVESVLWKA